MAQAGIQVSLDVREIYVRLCPKCRRVVKDLIKEKMTDQLVDQMIGAESKNEQK